MIVGGRRDVDVLEIVGLNVVGVRLLLRFWYGGNKLMVSKDYVSLI
jgi:hypothetical protein